MWAPVYKNIIYNLNQVKLSQGTKKLLVYLNFQQNLDHQFVLNFHQNVLFIVRTPDPSPAQPASGSDQEQLRSLQRNSGHCTIAKLSALLKLRVTLYGLLFSKSQL